MRQRKSDGRPMGTLDRKPKSPPAEISCYEELHSQGYFTVTKKGFPDFWAIKNGEIILVECKRDGQKLSKSQFLLFKFLSSYGVPCYYYSEKLRFRRFRDFKITSPYEDKQLKAEKYVI